MRKILHATANDRLRAVYLLAFSLGLRQGELFGLRWSDVDLDRARITIRQQACEVGGRVTFKSPKTESGTRTVSISASIVESLRDRRKASEAEGHAETGLVFTNEVGNVIHRSNFGHRQWQPLLQKLKIKHRGFHVARHTAASLMLGAGVPIHVVSQILGHAKPSITLDLYSHLMPHQASVAADVLDRLSKP